MVSTNPSDTRQLSPRVLVVDDERAFLEELAHFLHANDIQCSIAANGNAALHLLAERDFDLLLADLVMPGISGSELIKKACDVAPETLALLMTANPSVDSAVSAMRSGALDYIIKPFRLEDLLVKIRYIVEFRNLKREVRWHRERLDERYALENLIGKSPAMIALQRQILRAASTSRPVLLSGESGTGKELVAHSIHQKGPRRHNSFIPVNCAAIPPSLLDAQLFGHRKGAFTGAESENKGLFVAANTGTLLLDEIADMPVELQPKLLRAIENQEIIPVGGHRPIHIDVRIIASTYKDLEQEMAAGRFRQDLYYRLSVLTIHVPPLRNRPEDIRTLAEHFLQEFNKEMPRQYTGVSNDALKCLLRHEWKGNVRELKNVIEQAMIRGEGGLITPDLLPSRLLRQKPLKEKVGLLKEEIQRFEVEYISKILSMTNDDKHLAADLLGLSLSSLYRKLQESENA